MSLSTEFYAKIKTLVKEGKGFFSVSGGKYADGILGSILWLFLAKFLPTAKYGCIIYWYSLGLLSASVSYLGYQRSIKTFFPKGKRNITIEGNFLSLFPTFISIVILALFIPFSVFGVLIFVFFQTRYKLSIAEILAQRKYQEFFYIVTGKRLIQIIFGLSLYYLIGINGILIGLSIGLAATSYRSLKHLFASPNFDFPVTKAHSSYILYTFAISTILRTTARIDRVLIGFFYNNTVLGVYGFVSQITAFLIMFPRSFRPYLLPEKSAGQKAKLAEIVGVIGSTILSVLAFAFSPWGMAWLFDKFTSAIPAIRIVSLTPILVMFSTILITTFLSEEKGQTPFITAVVSRSVRIGGVIGLYHFFGIIGVGMALLFEQLSRMLVLWMKKGWQGII